MHPLARIDSQITTCMTIMWVFRGLSVLPTLLFLSSLYGGTAVGIAVSLVFMVPFTAVHFTMWFKIQSLKRERLRFLPPPMPRSPYGYPPNPPSWR